MHYQFTQKVSSPLFVAFFLLFSTQYTSGSEHTSPKIVGLICARNEEFFIENCIRALSHYTDAIVVLDDASQDETVNIVQAIAHECHIERIIQKTSWDKFDDCENRGLLIKAGREIGGTHFIMIDSDEMFTALCRKDDWLRHQILTLKPGQELRFPMINLWESLDYYRDDTSCSPHHDDLWQISMIFCDDGICSYEHNKSHAPSGKIHVRRCPAVKQCNEPEQCISIDDINYGVLHFKCVDLQDAIAKRVWYMCLEYLLITQGITDLHECYAKAVEVNNFHNRRYFFENADPRIIQLSPCDPSWFDYNFLDKNHYTFRSTRRIDEVLRWITTHGQAYFKNLNIWHVDWLQALSPKVVHQTTDDHAMHYCKEHNNTFIAVIYPIAQGLHDEVRNIFQQHCKIVYEKYITIEKEGPLNFIKLAYQQEPWFEIDKGIRHAHKRFSVAAPLRIFLLECDSLEAIITCKRQIRALFGMGDQSIHINDTHDQTMVLARVLFNEQCIDALNNTPHEDYTGGYCLYAQ